MIDPATPPWLVVRHPEHGFPRVAGDGLGPLVLRLWRGGMGEQWRGFAVFESTDDPARRVAIRARVQPNSSPAQPWRVVHGRREVAPGELDEHCATLMRPPLPTQPDIAPPGFALHLDGIDVGFAPGDSPGLHWSVGRIAPQWQHLEEAVVALVARLDEHFADISQPARP